MAKRKFTEEQMLTVVKQLEAGRTAAEMAREVGVEHLHDLLVEGKVRRRGTK